MSYWLSIGLSGIATYLTRALPLVVTPRGEMPDWLRRYLDALPIAVIAALAGAGIAVQDSVPSGGAEVGGAALTIVIGFWRRNLLFAVLAGVATVAGLRALGL